MVKPAPEIETEFTVTADVPDDVSVTDFVAEEFIATLSKFRAEELIANCEFAATD